MAPPTKFARLNQIDPEQLGIDVSQAVHEPVYRLAIDLGLECRESGIDQLPLSVRDLATYARFGGELDAPVEEYLITICPPVWMRAWDAGPYSTPEYDTADPDTLETDWRGQLVLVMRAAVAREQLAAGKSIGAGDLAALASMAAGSIRELLASGGLTGERAGREWRISAADALAFLARREARAAQE